MINKKNIAIVIPTLTLWGWAEKVATDIGKYFSQNHNVFYFTFHKDEKKYKLWGSYYSLNQKNSSWILKIFYIPINAFYLRNFCKKNNINVIISHMERSNYIAILASFFLKNIKQISVVHSFKYSFELFHKWMIFLFYKKSYKIICVSQVIQNALEKKFWLDNLKTIFNSIDIEDIESLSKKKLEDSWDAKYFHNRNIKTIIHIWKLRDAKRQERIIYSFFELQKKKKNMQLIIIGEWNKRRYLEKVISDLKLEKQVFLIGKRKNIFPYLKKSDIFVFSSEWEWFWLVLVEALTQNLPILSTDCKAWPREILAPELWLDEKISYPYKWKYGVLENPEFNVKSFAHSMNKILHWEYDFEKKWYQRFDKNIIFSEWEKLI